MCVPDVRRTGIQELRRRAAPFYAGAGRGGLVRTEACSEAFEYPDASAVSTEHTQTFSANSACEITFPLRVERVRIDSRWKQSCSADVSGLPDQSGAHPQSPRQEEHTLATPEQCN